MSSGNGLCGLELRTKSQTLQIRASSSGTSSQATTPPLTPQASLPARGGRIGSTSTTQKRRTSPQQVEAATFPTALPGSQHNIFKPDQLSGSFEELIAGDEATVLVDFYAPWCGPCELMGRVISKLSLELKEDLKVVKVNTDNYPKLASKYRIQALPTCLLFRDGVLIDRVNGYMPESSFGRRVRFYVARLDKKFGRR